MSKMGFQRMRTLLLAALLLTTTGCGAGGQGSTSSTAAEGTVTVYDGGSWVAAKAGDTLELKLDGETKINRIRINEVTYGAVQTFHIEVLDGGEWKRVYDNDYILAGRTCILPEDVTTTGVRLVIDSLAEEATIDSFSADYQESNGNSAFMNVGYASSQWYETLGEGFKNTPDQLDTMTDLIMINNFTFDKEGNFAITAKKGGAKSHPQDSAEGRALLDQWIAQLKSDCPNLAAGKTRLWFCLTAVDNDAKVSGAFNDEAVRTKFVSEVVKLAQAYQMYGVDVDWEYPTTDESLSAFHLLLQTLSEQLHAAGIKLSCTACPNYKKFLDKEQYDVLDYVSWMTYTNNQNDSENVQAQVPYYKMRNLINETIEKGCDPAKIWIGLPYFGKPVGKPAATYRELAIEYLKKNDTLPKGLNRIEKDGLEYLYNGAYLLEDKVAFAAETGCGGVMSWWYGQDVDAFADSETDTAKGVTMTGEQSLVRTVYEAVERFTGVDPRG